MNYAKKKLKKVLGNGVKIQETPRQIGAYEPTCEELVNIYKKVYYGKINYHADFLGGGPKNTCQVFVFTLWQSNSTDVDPYCSVFCVGVVVCSRAKEDLCSPFSAAGPETRVVPLFLKTLNPIYPTDQFFLE